MDEMDIAAEISLYNKKSLNMTVDQRSLVRFYETTPYGISLNSRQSGMSTSIMCYAAWKFDCVPEQTCMLIILPNNQSVQYMDRDMRDHLQRLNTSVRSIRRGHLQSPVTESEIIFASGQDDLRHKFRGRRYDDVFVDGFTGECNFSRSIQQSLPELLPLVANKGRVHLVGTSTTNNADPGGLLESARGGKSYFRMWDRGMRDLVEKLTVM